VKRFIFFILGLTLFCSQAIAEAMPTWQTLRGYGSESHLAACAWTTSELWVASAHHIYHSDDGQAWQHSLRLPRSSTVQFMKPTNHSDYPLVVGTSDGLWVFHYQTQSWKKIFQQILEEQNVILSFAVNNQAPHQWILGTQRGAFISTDYGQSWNSVAGPFQKDPIVDIAFHPIYTNLLFFATPKGLYRSEDIGRHASLVLNLSEQEVVDTFSEVETDEEATSDSIASKLIYFRNENSPFVYFLSQGTLYESQDSGKSWAPFRPLLHASKSAHIGAYNTTNDSFYIVDESVYQYRQMSTWQKLPAGLLSTQIHDLAVAHDGRVLLATARGAYLLEPFAQTPNVSFTPQDSFIELNHINMQFKQEPTIRQTQQAAIQYANVSNQKIQSWQRQSRLQALLPSVSVGIDGGIGNNIQMDRGSTNDPDIFLKGPADRDFGWDVDARWDLADLIWSSSQTSIDSREKLMIELREDILSEVTRLYFERRRLIVQTMSQTFASDSEYYQQLIQIDEITAHLDALTDGWFSLQLYADGLSGNSEMNGSS